MFHKVRKVLAVGDYRLCIQFAEGATKIYDVKKLFKKFPVFQISEKEFNKVVVGPGGYGIIWNDDLDLSCNELWENGETIKTHFDGLIAMSDATELWNLNESTLRKAISYGKLIDGVDVCKFGKQWVVAEESMIREYGKPRK